MTCRGHVRAEPRPEPQFRSNPLSRASKNPVISMVTGFSVFMGTEARSSFLALRNFCINRIETLYFSVKMCYIFCIQNPLNRSK